MYRGKIQISPAAVGAMPEIKTLTMRGANDKEWIEVGEEVTYSYTGRADADGYVSRGMALREKAFGIPTEQLDFDDQSKFSLSFWFKVNQFNHEEYGTQFVNIRSAASIWPESDWGYFWSLFDHENKFSVSFRSNLSSSGMKIEMLEDISFDEGVWYHVAFVYGYTDDNRTLEIYLNGKLHCSCQLGDYGIISWKSSNIIMIGGRAFGRAGLDGVIDEVRLYNKALTAEEIKSTMQHHLLPVTDENFIGYWDFETDSNSENCLISTGGNTSLIAKLYDPSVPSSEGNEYLSQSISFIVGVPFISGTNYKIKTLPSWTLKQASVISTEGDSEAGSATALYSEAGTYTATLTLSNGWGSDTKTIEVVTIVGTGIEDDVTLEEMQAFPNPFDNEVYANFVEEGNYTVEIYDYSGRLLNTIVLYASAGEIYQIPVEGISGIYFIKVKGESGLLKVMKVAKR